MIAFFGVLIFVFCFSSFIFFYLEDFYKNPLNKSLADSAIEALVETILLIFVLVGFTIIFQ